jgi:peptidoglycan hydrolase-like protein with peptidoglycan-binding domain
MNANFIRYSLLSLSFLSAISLTTLPFSTACAQTSRNSIVIAADGNLNEYSPATAPLLVRSTVSPAVKDVQILLRELGFYYGDADSIYGPRTVSAVISFQRSRNLIAHGAVDKPTWEALIDADNLTSPVPVSDLSKYSPQTAPLLRLGSRGTAVRDIQGFLKQQGYYTGTVDGIYGTATAAAMESFQQRYDSLKNDGVVGPRTWVVIINTARASVQ